MLVSKTVSPEVILQAMRAGHLLFGENKVQELISKAALIEDHGAEFHFIGHLQSNKVKPCVQHAAMIHSLDRLSLAQALDTQLQKLGRSMDVLIQVNTSNEESKFGVSPERLIDLVKEVTKYDTLNLKGLMTLAKFSADDAIVRACFRRLKESFDSINESGLTKSPMTELSMGMSNDYLIAIEEGATIVRVGTAVFGARILNDVHYWPE